MNTLQTATADKFEEAVSVLGRVFDGAAFTSLAFSERHVSLLLYVAIDPRRGGRLLCRPTLCLLYAGVGWSYQRIKV